ncbi:TonB-dependent receptor [Aquisediminimonas profunda]|uniref:TonB-dependent receptor n=1 Tax=Aquisediminimonas profunda TaxID=1550733 RepID=UPI001C62DFA3|nr:TonB-dependent receptor [Aquisediminimonas profunda]
MSLERALRKLLEHTGYTFVMVDARTVRIVRAPSPVEGRVRSGPSAPHAKSVQPASQTDGQPPDIIVNASKQGQSLTDYAGSVRVETVGAIGLTSESGTSALVGRLPELVATNLGPGRNKLFVRGIADSSFSGPTQSTVGLYLGELRLTYNAPEPDLRLYDIDAIEVIEGPQGTLYGAGALGGIVHIAPNLPDLEGFHANASLGSAMTADGRDSYDTGGMLNIPLVTDKVAVRVVGYRQRLGGYIDNATLGLKDTNTTRISGGRAALRASPGNHWEIEIAGLSQSISTSDGQYSDRGLAPLTHAAAIAQPHESDFGGGNLVITKRWGGLKLVSSTGIVRHDLTERFDATGLAGTTGVIAYDRDEAIRMFTHETRLSSRAGSMHPWVAGLSYVNNVDRIAQALGPPSATAELSRVRNERREIALFGEGTIPLSSRWSLTAGARFLRARAAGILVSGPQGPEPTRHQTRVLPTLAILWKPNDDLQVFARLRSGFRSGGIAVDPGGNVVRFVSDKLYTGEAGLRFGHSGGPLSGNAALSYARWRSIQADLLDSSGFPATANIGNGHVLGFSADLAWRPVSSLLVEGALFANRSSLDNPAVQLVGLDETSLPNVPRYGARLSARYSRPLSPDLTLVLDGSAHYRSGSNVGTVPPLLLEQGEYVEAGLSAALDAGSWKLTLDATNLFNGRENSFAFGNPFSVGLGQQQTPLRPRTIRLGVSFGF